MNGLSSFVNFVRFRDVVPGARLEPISGFESNLVIFIWN